MTSFAIHLYGSYNTLLPQSLLSSDKLGQGNSVIMKTACLNIVEFKKTLHIMNYLLTYYSIFNFPILKKREDEKNLRSPLILLAELNLNESSLLRETIS